MKIRPLILIGLSVAALGALSAPLKAEAGVSVFLSVPPPPVRVEVVPAPRHGYVWVPGYWDVKHRRHTWHDGYWVRERRGYYYAPPRWVQRSNRWELERGAWHRGHRDARWDDRRDGDRDRDGVPDRHDRQPYNPRAR